MIDPKKKKNATSAAKKRVAAPGKKGAARTPKKLGVRATRAAESKKAGQVEVAAAQVPAVHDGKMPVFDLKGKTTETITIDPMFHEGHVNTDIIYQAVLKYQAGQREGTAATKTRGEVSGGGKKPWKQKHTGRARHASIRSPLWRGGGVVFGPHPKDYSYTLPLQIRRKAVAEGVKDKVVNGKLVLVNGLDFSSPKTKLMTDVLKTFKLEKALVLVDEKKANVLLSSRNIPYIDVKSADEVNALDVVSHKSCLMTKAAYTGLLKRLKS